MQRDGFYSSEVSAYNYWFFFYSNEVKTHTDLFCSMQTTITPTLVMSERKRQYRDTKVEEWPLYELVDAKPSTSHDINDNVDSQSSDHQSHDPEPHEHEPHDHQMPEAHEPATTHASKSETHEPTAKGRVLPRHKSAPARGGGICSTLHEIDLRVSMVEWKLDDVQSDLR